GLDCSRVCRGWSTATDPGHPIDQGTDHSLRQQRPAERCCLIGCITTVSSKEFIPAVSGEDNLHVLPSEPAQHIDWKPRSVSEGFVVVIHVVVQQWDQIEVSHLQLVVRSPESGRHLCRVRELLIAPLPGEAE